MIKKVRLWSDGKTWNRRKHKNTPRDGQVRSQTSLWQNRQQPNGGITDLHRLTAPLHEYGKEYCLLRVKPEQNQCIMDGMDISQLTVRRQHGSWVCQEHTCLWVCFLHVGQLGLQHSMATQGQPDSSHDGQSLPRRTFQCTQWKL